ncbi:MAG: copper-sensing transcriptional repressor CsoR [Ktedonobacteraceae bacterium]
MTSVNHLSEATRNDIAQRLKRIEGQARGIQRMMEEERDCREVLNQIAAMRAATHALGMQLLEEFVLHCMQQPNNALTTEQVVAQMIGAVSKLTR